MKRVLVVDDEQHVIDWIALLLKRDLAGEFVLCGSARSGRQAIECAPALNPDIVLMDVAMPGLSGLDAIREMRGRCQAVFILVTAFERFDIARDAVELGVLDYLLKPVAKDKLAAALRAAARFQDQRSDLESRAVAGREQAERLRGFAESGLLRAIMLGEPLDAVLPDYRAALGLGESEAVVGAAACLAPAGSPDPEAEARRLHQRFQATLRYKSTALAGPLVAGQAALLLPVPEGDGGAALAALKGVLARDHAEDLAKGRLRLGFARPRPLAAAGAAWAEALGDLLGGRRDPARSDPGDPPFEDDEAALEALAAGAPDRAGLALERLLEPFRAGQEPTSADHGRFAALFGAAARILARQGRLGPGDAFATLDFSDLAAGGPAFPQAVRTRFQDLAARVARTPRWSPPVARAVEFVQEHLDRPINLEEAAVSVGLSPNRLSRRFAQETGRGFSDFLIEYRIERAKALLGQPGTSVKQVSLSCGYSDPNYFSRQFKKVTGLTPSAFSSGAAEAGDDRS